MIIIEVTDKAIEMKTTINGVDYALGLAKENTTYSRIQQLYNSMLATIEMKQSPPFFITKQPQILQSPWKKPFEINEKETK